MGVEHRVVVDGAAASIIARGLGWWTPSWWGVNRVTATGDVANKIGTCPLALPRPGPGRHPVLITARSPR